MIEAMTREKLIKGSQPGEPDTHIHIWLIDRHNIGTCKCGEVRQFPWDGRSPTIVLKRGNLSTNQVKTSQVKTSQVKEEHMQQHHMEKHKYYEENKEKILADLRSIGRKPTCIKWSIPSPTMAQLEKRWITPQEKKELSARSHASRKSPAGRQAVVTTPTNNHLPSFPEFSNEWVEVVQIKWFEVYEQLRGIQQP